MVPFFCSPLASKWRPSSRIPVPQSRMNRSSPARISTQEVLPPNSAVDRPGTATEPRTPQKVTFTCKVLGYIRLIGKSIAAIRHFGWGSARRNPLQHRQARQEVLHAVSRREQLARIEDVVGVENV